MKTTDFANHLTEYLAIYLPKQRHVSKNTIYSYRDTFKLLIHYCQMEKAIAVEKLTMDMLSKELIVDFLLWLEQDKKCSISTRNQRLAAIRAFFIYVQYEDPTNIAIWQKICSIPVKKTASPIVEYLTVDAIKLLLQQPDRTTKKGRRDLTLISVLYDSGARVQELIDLRICDITLQGINILTLTGKGNKIRQVPIEKNTADLLQNYILENQLDKSWKNECPVFTNSSGHQLTRNGVFYIISVYARAARHVSAIVPSKVKSHMLRHSKAMHLLQAGVNIVYIRDFLGHVDIKTTDIYAQTNIEMKRAAIQNIYPELIDNTLPDWNKDCTLIDWLSNLK